MASYGPQDLCKRVEQMFDDRRPWESYWDTAYRFMMPERATFFSDDNKTDPGSIGDEIFDSTAEDSAERLANLIVARLTPPWQQWFKLEPGDAVQDGQERKNMLPALELATKKILRRLADMNFYQELQPALLDRIVGGTGTLSLELGSNDSKGVPPRFRSRPLNQVAISEDAGGEIMEVALQYQLSLDQLERAYPGKVPQEYKEKYGQNPGKCEHTVITHEIREVEGNYTRTAVLKGAKTELYKATNPFATLLPTRWSKIPGTPYGRGPGLRALSDTRAVNKLKELSLRNAALEVGAPYTAVDDGILNPYTISLQPFEIIPVSSNDINNPSLRPLERPGNFDVSMLSVDELRNSIKAIFMQDQFGNAERTPRSAAEVMERTRVLSQDLGASVSRIQQEQIKPAIRAVVSLMVQDGELPEEMDELNEDLFKLSFTSYLAQGQWAEEAQSTMQLMNLCANFGQTDPEAGMVVDFPEALAHIGNLTGVPQRLINGAERRKQQLQKGTEGMAAANQAGTMGGGGEEGEESAVPPEQGMGVQT